jgi:hypothetical protein
MPDGALSFPERFGCSDRSSPTPPIGGCRILVDELAVVHPAPDALLARVAVDPLEPCRSSAMHSANNSSDPDRKPDDRARDISRLLVDTLRAKGTTDATDG